MLGYFTSLSLSLHASSDQVCARSIYNHSNQCSQHQIQISASLLPTSIPAASGYLSCQTWRPKKCLSKCYHNNLFKFHGGLFLLPSSIESVWCIYVSQVLCLVYCLLADLMQGLGELVGGSGHGRPCFC